MARGWQDKHIQLFMARTEGMPSRCASRFYFFRLWQTKMTSGDTLQMMTVDIQMMVTTNETALVKAKVRAIKQSIQTDHLIALIALSINWQRLSSCFLLN